MRRVIGAVVGVLIYLFVVFLGVVVLAILGELARKFTGATP